MLIIERLTTDAQPEELQDLDVKTERTTRVPLLTEPQPNACTSKDPWRVPILTFSLDSSDIDGFALEAT